MSTEETRQHFKFVRSARNWGISALAAAAIGGYALYQRSEVNAGAVEPIQVSVASIPVQTTPDSTALYIDGEYTGDSVRAGRWGNVQVTVVIENGQITDFTIEDYPHSRSTSQRINRVALPYLMEEAVQAQSADIDIISGATPTSEAFIASLQSALEDATNGTAPASNTTTGASL